VDTPVEEELLLDFPEYMPVVKTPPPPPVEYLVDMRTYLSSGWVTNDISTVGKVKFADRGRNLFGESDTVFLDLDSDAALGDLFLATRKVKNVKHPHTGEGLGRQIRVTGLIEVIGFENDTPKAKIIEMFDQVKEGDSLIVYNGSKPPVKTDTTRTPDINGYIIATRMDNSMAVEDEIVYLDKGAEEGLMAGDVLSIQDNTPTGTLQVISTKAHTAAAVILQVQQEVRIGDTFGKK
jgi:hypothetical protein